MSKISIDDIFRQFKEVTGSSDKFSNICKTFIKQEGRKQISTAVKQMRSVCDTFENILIDGKEEVEGEEENTIDAGE